VNLHWIKGSLDDPSDLCAHGHVEFRVGSDVLLDAALGPEVTVSAAALYLLRTLTAAHSKQGPVGDHLFPCCGFAMWDVGEPDVVISGCPNGVDFEVLPGGDNTEVLVRAEGGREWRLQQSEWQAAVFEFADCVSGFYATSSQKQPSADDEAGYRKFVAEWERRRGLPLGLTDGSGRL
jgi:hypothetical protein